jgi:hypothetical protein
MESTRSSQNMPDWPHQSHQSHQSSEPNQANQLHESMEEQITELWGHINAATYRFLKLVAEYDALEGWGWHGCADCAQWLNWQCGIGAVAAREKVRVARALGEVPKISASFEKGEISYSKVRAMTRIATLENEEVLLNIALHGTAAHMERLVRQYRRVERLEDAWLANEQHRLRFLNYRYDDDGSMLLEARLPPEVGALLKTAIESAEETLFRQEREAEKEAPPEETSTNDALPNEDAPIEDPPEEGSTTLQNIVSAETSSDRYPDADADAECEEDSAGARRADALALLAERYVGEAAKETESSDRYLVTVHIDQAALSEKPEKTDREGKAWKTESSSGDSLARLEVSDDTLARISRSEIEDGPSLAAATARRLACDGPLVGIVEGDDGEPLSVGRRTRAIPPAVKRALASRDGGCRFPSCNRTRFTEGHHIEHWADGGETKLTNLITLCRFHHRLLHEGGFGLRVTDDGLFVFSRPDGTRIAEADVSAETIPPNDS